MIFLGFIHSIVSVGILDDINDRISSNKREQEEFSLPLQAALAITQRLKSLVTRKVQPALPITNKDVDHSNAAMMKKPKMFDWLTGCCNVSLGDLNIGGGNSKYDDGLSR